MKIEFISNISKKISRNIMIGSSYHSFNLNCSIIDLKRAFGMYQSQDGYKVKAEFVLLFFICDNNGYNGKIVPISIYDYKEYDTNLKDIRDWHIGNFAQDNQEVALIFNWINQRLKESSKERDRKK